MYYHSLGIMADPSGKGTRPSGSDVDGANWVYLDNNESLVWLPTPISHPSLVELATDKDEILGVTTRTAFANLTKDRSIPATTLKATIADILTNPPSGRWNRLRPSRLRQQYEIYLGPGGAGKNMLHTQPTFVPSASVAWVDSFDRANGNLNASTSSDSNFIWTEVAGTEWEILGNLAQCVDIVNSTFNVAVLDRDMDTDDNYVEYTISTFTRAANSYLVFDLLLRGTAFGTGANGYAAEFGINSSNATANIIYNWATGANIVTDTTATPSSGTFRFECDGSSLTAYRNGVTVMAATNSSFAGEKRSGIASYADTVSTNDLAINDFATGDLVSGHGLLLSSLRNMMVFGV